MKEFVEKLIGRLEELKSNPSEKTCRENILLAMQKNLTIYSAIEIVNQLAEEYNNGWIACDKELPKIPNSYLVTKMCEDDGNRIYETAHEIFWTSDGKWDCERDKYCEWKVIAWRKKLAPYQKGSDV